MKRILAILIGAMILSVNAAYAVPVGSFSWNEDFIQGSIFHVENFSSEPASIGGTGISFFDVFVNLETDTGNTNLQLGNITPGIWKDTTDDLTGFNIISASLSLQTSTGTISTPILYSTWDTGIIDYTSPSTPGPEPSQVPEPSTLLLLGSGVILLLGFALQNGRQQA